MTRTNQRSTHRTSKRSTLNAQRPTLNSASWSFYDKNLMMYIAMPLEFDIQANYGRKVIFLSHRSEQSADV
jgi:hypothetical protein